VRREHEPEDLHAALVYLAEVGWRTSEHLFGLLLEALQVRAGEVALQLVLAA